MGKVILDAVTTERFAAAGGRVKVVGADGQVLGEFFPAVPRAEPFTDDEIREALADPLTGGRTLAEIRAEVMGR